VKSDWDTPKDRGPGIEEPENRWRSRPSGKKPFAIERRYIGDNKWLAVYAEWKVWKKYKTEKDRSNALDSLRKNQGSYFPGRWEYREKA
jgi:hypothetical protein